jgi:surface carbohydrate biosynthesis protein
MPKLLFSLNLKKNYSILQFGLEGKYFLDKIYIKKKRYLYELGTINIFIFMLPKLWNNFFYLKSLKLSYFKTLFEILKVKKVITWLDNNSTFQQLDFNLKNIKFIAFQNGYRSHFDLVEKKIFHSNFFCFSKNEIKRYKNYKHNVENFYDLGSLKLNIIMDGLKKNKFNLNKLKKEMNKEKLAIIDELPDIIFKNVKDKKGAEIRSPKHRTEGYIKMLRYISKYCYEEKIIPNIILRYPKNTLEAKKLSDIYKSIFNSRLKILYNDDSYLKSYLYCYLSNILLGCRSTLLIESFGLGKKILSCNYSGDSNFAFPRDIFCTISEKTDYKYFKKKIGFIKKMKKSVWKKRTKNDRKNIMSLAKLKKYNQFI